MKYNIVLLTLLYLTQTACATTSSSSSIGMPCADPSVQKMRSQELQKIRKADQEDRNGLFMPNSDYKPSQSDLEKMASHDLRRRMRVGEIAGEGCLKTAADFEAAFLVYQHGNTSDQFLQAMTWSSEALRLGQANMKPEIAMAVDRYLVSTNHKQLFGTQASEPTLGGCWCIQPIEESFPPSVREEYRGGSSAAYTGLEFLKTLNAKLNCPATYCETQLQPSPKGSVPGFW